MRLHERCDGKLLRDLPSFRQFFPYVMRGRNESAVYFKQQVIVDNVLNYLEKTGAHPGSRKIRLFHVFLCAAVRTLALRPDLNRFVAGRRLYQRNKIQISFIVKKELNEEAEETNAKITFEPSETLETVAEKVDGHIAIARDSSRSRGEEETIRSLIRFPSLIIRLVTRVFRALDYFGLAPSGMIDADPLYTSAYIANLGSIGLDAPFHHLYEWGTASIFAVIGKLHKAPIVDETGNIKVGNVVNITYTVDDRITDGMYCAHAIELLSSFILRPELLEKPPVFSSDREL